MKQTRIVLDTNILVSAILFGGKPEKILNLAYHKEFVWSSSAALLEELETTLHHKKFSL